MEVSQAHLTAELQDFLGDWELSHPLTKDAAFDALTDTFVSGYTDTDSGDSVEFSVEDVVWQEDTTDVDDLESDSLAALCRVRQGWPDCEITGVEWTAEIKRCGDLCRRCVRISRSDGETQHTWYAQPPEWADEFTDRTFGPMWEDG